MVVEPGTNAAVPDAEITLDFLGADRPRYIPAPSQATFTAKTDTSGSFVFHLDKTGYYTVRAKKEGFSESGGMSGAASTQSVTLTADAPSVEVRLYLARPARITGRVVEEESRKPIANLQVIAGRATNFAGRRMFMRSTTSTDAEGRFQVAALPGDYVVEIGPTTRGKDRILTKFSEADTDAVDQDFERTFLARRSR